MGNLRACRLTKGRRQTLGFTVVEVLVTFLLIGISATVAIPAYQSFIATNRIKTAAFDMVADLTLARSEAIKRNANVKMIANTTRQTDCTLSADSAAWANGWTLCVGNIILRSHVSLTGLAISESSGALSITYNSIGRPASATSRLMFTVDVATPSTKASPRCVGIDISGRVAGTLRQGASC